MHERKQICERVDLWTAKVRTWTTTKVQDSRSWKEQEVLAIATRCNYSASPNPHFPKLKRNTRIRWFIGSVMPSMFFENTLPASVMCSRQLEWLPSLLECSGHSFGRLCWDSDLVGDPKGCDPVGPRTTLQQFGTPGYPKRKRKRIRRGQSITL